ncbi:MAG TPA: transcriptional repressor LexA [Lacipirellulaceae bacterium]|nr:transcriptional repressor LexA [Lacipirellulaceae bacterium]
MQAATPKQRKIADFVSEYWHRHGFGPSHQDIADKFRFSSTNAVRSHLGLMKRKGLINYEEGVARTIRVIDDGAPQDTNGIPLIGRIPAGIPFAVLQDMAERLPISPELFAGDQLFALRVEGQSMRDAGILDGDFAILNHQEDVADGQIAAVLIDEVATLKQFFRKKDCVVLHAANPDFEDIVLRAEIGHRVAIAGRLVGVVRNKHIAAA